MSESEWKTRKVRIDKKLKALSPSWRILPYSSSLDLSSLNNIAVEEFPTDNGPADYALFVQGKLLGIIEAKKVGVSPSNVLEQAKRYSQGVNLKVGKNASEVQEAMPIYGNDFKVPFLYATNGEVIWFADVRTKNYLSREISNFHTPDAIYEAWSTDKISALEWLSNTPPESVRLRPYQRDAITSVEDALASGRRKMLVAMATGTGKTFTTVSLCYRLIASKYARRILFLVDRRALAAQATLAFHVFDTPRGNKFNQEYEIYSQRFRRDDWEEEDGKPSTFDPKVLDEKYLTEPRANHTFVYVTTIQRMAINLFGREGAFPQGASDPDTEDDADRLDIPIHAFDVIVADECHRGYTAQEEGIWRKVINHFDAIKVGLTATPAKHTLSLFETIVNGDGEGNTTDQAIADGYLVDYEAVAITSGVRIDGVFLKEGENVEYVDTTTGTKQYHVLEDENDIEALQIVIERPKSWCVKALSELREKLKINGFSENNLQKAHEFVNHKALADIISIVKKGAREEQLLLTAEERVRNALAYLRQEKQFNEEQTKWLSYIEEHLVKNLSLSKDDFDAMPVFFNHGGLGRARKVFGNDLDYLIEEINYKLAA